MAKFGLFNSGFDEPKATYQGDSMTIDKEFVRIYRRGSDPMARELVAVMRLEKGHDVGKLSD